ncbi:hypothetical protein EG347_08355 [Chryseobacterium sp. G0186]|uniref:hypothetical protein n=1 Tax=Chryseobacterium sp. G0186 TaxID=2487064 RepID=UPI000F4E3F0F|nr:hypothetical protein [Chryseobacterium sp. G0186]AZA77523.1 hypothetical protein EG347_08355 [Chryseobacterium sp. G0186]
MNFKYLWIFLILISCRIFSQEQNYIPYRKGAVWGLCDPQKFTVIQPQYQSISWYDESIRGYHAEQNGRFGIISKNAEIIMPFISHERISVDGDKFLVFDGWEYYYYSINTRMRLEKFIRPESRPIRDSGWEYDLGFKGGIKEIALSWDDLDDEDIEILEPFDNDQYQLNYSRDFLEITEGETSIGIYIPEFKKIFFNKPDLKHIGWRYYKGKPYIFTENASNLLGLVDINSREIYQNKYKEISLLDFHQLVFLSEPDPENHNNLILRTILPNNKVLNGKFEPLMTLTKNGMPFQIYYTIINGQKNYAGEDGTLYFEG